MIAVDDNDDFDHNHDAGDVGANDKESSECRNFVFLFIDEDDTGTCKGPRSCCHATKSGTAVSSRTRAGQQD